MKKEPSFEEALNVASIWCIAWEKGELSDEVLADRVSELLETKTGARGFFVISLSGDFPLMDRIPDALVFQLIKSGEIVIDLIVKNLAMSTAMTLKHKRDQNFLQKDSSERIKQRCIELLKLLQPNLVKDRIEKLLNTINGKSKDDAKFLKRWGFDTEQKKAIISSINAIAEH